MRHGKLRPIAINNPAEMFFPFRMVMSVAAMIPNLVESRRVVALFVASIFDGADTVVIFDMTVPFWETTEGDITAWLCAGQFRAFARSG